VALVGVADVEVHAGARRAIATATGHADRAFNRRPVADLVIAAVGVRLLPAAARAVVTDQADVAEGGVRLHAHVVGARGRRGEGAALAVAAAVRPAVVAAVGRYAATLDVQVGVAAAAGHGERQAGRTGRHFQRVHHIVTRGGRQAGDRHTLLQAAL